jgi:hypothetical protein
MITKTGQIFTIEQAKSMLPLLRLIVTDISLAHRELTERKSNRDFKFTTPKSSRSKRT